MRPLVGIGIELLALAAALWSSVLIPTGAPYAVYILVAQFLAAFLIHCPAHYAIGTLVGIRFLSINVGRTTLARALPRSLGPFARLIPILTLSTDKASLERAPRSAAAAMFLSGTIASSASAIFIAIAVSLSGLSVAAALAWLFALGWLLFDVYFSPKSGDVMRARRQLMR